MEWVYLFTHNITLVTTHTSKSDIFTEFKVVILFLQLSLV